ncbi:hypothetical protein DOY81_004994, partial [Sarcophaga bullata]
YSEMYNNPIKATNMEHRDVVLDILSDARVVGPLMQTGLFHADVNRRNYMYVFGHNSFGGPHASLPHSIAGEELAFVFGAPLASAGLFHGTQYTAQEKLLTEAVMSYWCNFAKTGNPKAPWKGNFINLHALEWDRYDLEWPEFNKRSQAYMNIGIPPSVGYKYRQIYMSFWNKELPDELNQIAQIQQQPFLQTNNYNSNYNGHNIAGEVSAVSGTTAIYPKRYGTKLDVITGHMNKFGTRDNGAEDPVRTLKLLLQEPYAPAATSSIGKNTQAENMYNAPPSTQYKGIVIAGEGGNDDDHDDNNDDDDDDEVKTQGYEIRYNNGYTPRMLHTTRTPPYAAVYGSRQFELPFNGAPKSIETGLNEAKFNDLVKTNKNNNNNNNNNSPYANEDVKPSGDEAENQEHVAKSETTLHLLIGLIIVFIILNVIIYSTFLLQKKKKTKTLQRKLGTGILSYDGTTDDDLKRSKTNTTQHGDDGDDSFIMDTMRKSNTYEQVKMERSPINGFKITRQLSCSTVDTHTKVSEWISTNGPLNKASIQRRPSSASNSKKSSSFSSTLRGSGSFGKPQPCKVSVAIDATPEGRGNSVLEQEPIEITKMKQDGRNIIICQDIEVEDQELLTPQDSLDNSRYTLMRQHSAVTEACEAELLQPMHQHSRSDPVEMYYNHNEKITSFINHEENNLQDINVTSKDDDYDVPKEMLTAEQQLNVIKRRKYPKVLPSLMQQERDTDSPPMTKDLSTTYKRNSLPPNSYFPHFVHIKQQPPLPPPRTVATLGRKPSIGRRNSNNITTSPLMVAHDYAEEEEDEPEITENTLIVGSLKPTEGYYSTLRRHNKPTNLNIQQQQTQTYDIPKLAREATHIPNTYHQHLHQQHQQRQQQQQQSVFQSFESQPPYHKTPERDIKAHLTEKVYCIQPPSIANDQHQPTCSKSEPTTPLYQTIPELTATTMPMAMINDDCHKALPPGVVYAQPKKSNIQRMMVDSAMEAAAAAASNSSNTTEVIHSNVKEYHVDSLQATSSNAVAYNCNDTTNCCQVMPMVLHDNQVSSKETLQTPDIKTTGATARIPQLHRNANVSMQQQQQQQTNNNTDETNANAKIPKATVMTPNILTAATTTTTTTTTELSNTKVLNSTPATTSLALTTEVTTSTSSALMTTPSALASAASAFSNCKSYDVATKAKKTSSITSTSSTLSSCSSLQSDTASSSSATSSSTGTVRTELQQK